MDPLLQIFERKPYQRSFFSELKRALWIWRKKKKMNRTSELVETGYDQVFSSSNNDWLRDIRSKRYEIVYGNELMLVDGLWLTTMYAHMVDIWLKIIGAKKVLEVGSGRGSLLFMLSTLNKELALTGLEQTSQGIERSREKQIELGTKIDFVQGNARALPFADNSFDVAFTVHVLESMPRDYHLAVSEMARVARYGIFVEEFREAQSVGDLMWLRFKDYFRSSYRDLNVRPIFFTKDIPHKPKYGMGLLVAELNKKTTRD